jgi:hypothetical protein
MNWLVVLSLGIGYVVIQRAVRAWVGREWVAERISNLTAVVLLLLSSSVGLGLVIVIGATILNPSVEFLLGLLPFLFFVVVVFGISMTAINYAALHGVREHLRAQREGLSPSSPDAGRRPSARG